MGKFLHDHTHFHMQMLSYYDFAELLRCFGESTLVDLVQLLFTRLSTFPEDSQDRDSASALDQVVRDGGVHTGQGQCQCAGSGS